MSDIIHLLPDSVANQIAAGEVIQRPASVIKELVENSVDAGSSHIDVVVEDAGKTSIQVVDDGKGMSETDARLAFERHATSKIREATDLFALRTMGFRGEALASIAAVAQVELRTRGKDNDLGTCVSIAGSEVLKQEPISCPVGSNFLVNNLFFNVPARRKFLKSNQTELNNILQEFERIALVHEDISFSLTHNGSLVLSLPKTSRRERIAGLFGKKMNEQLLSVEVETSLVHLSGFVGKPETSRKKGAHQYFFVNGRYMRHPYFHKAVMEAFEQLIPAGEQISYFLYFDVEPSNIDVNIHPTKTEIKFENELAIWQIIVAAVKEALGRFNAVPTIDFDTEGAFEMPVFGNSTEAMRVEAPKVEVNPHFNPFKTETKRPSKQDTSHWESMYNFENFESSKEPNQVEIDTFESETLYAETEHLLDTSTLHYQYKGKYIMTASKSGLMIIDQQRAHIRLLYDRYLAQISSRQGASQGVLFPDIVQFATSEIPVLQSVLEDLSFLGFELTDLGGGSYAINGVPAGIEGLNPIELVRNMVHTAIEKGCKVKEEVQSSLALSLAKAAAIVPGQILSSEEMGNLVDGLLTSAMPNYTPDGKIILSVVKEEELEKMFR